ncbi:MAG TPA: O-methyltransferase [Terrimesophilobacter sp.]|nr:O-methyltransferase [Terrimesophilobacter sp.]HRQ00199.1 O-methyltransferase [Terrimesophilobacter sp.]
MSSQQTGPDAWRDVDQYLSDQLVQQDAAFSDTLAASEQAGLPAIELAPTHAKLMHLLARMVGARRVLEIGTLGGYSTAWLARAVPAGGTVVTCEAVPLHAEVARKNLTDAGLDDRVQVRVGAALDTLGVLVDENVDPFDFVFIDADKANNPHYFEWALKLTRSGSVIVCDNVVRGGRVIDGESTDPDTIGTRTFLSMIGSDPRVDATAIQTVGLKGWDGFAIALVT